VSGLFVFHPLLRFCHRFSSAPAARRLTSFTGDSITFNIVALSACWKHVSNGVTSPSALIKTTAVAESWGGAHRGHRHLPALNIDGASLRNGEGFWNGSSGDLRYAEKGYQPFILEDFEGLMVNRGNLSIS
jgi:hypothetical protein